MILEICCGYIVSRWLSSAAVGQPYDGDARKDKWDDSLSVEFC